MATIKDNGQMSLEEFKKAVKEEMIKNIKNREHAIRFYEECENILDLYLEINLPPRETVQALRMGY